MKSCAMCGHPVGGPPAKDVRKESRCFPCLAGLLEIRGDLLGKSRDQLWKALSEILEAPALAIPVHLRRKGALAVKSAAQANLRLRDLA